MKNYTNIVFWLICLITISISITGCLWVPVPVTNQYYVLEGQTKVKQDNHSVTLCGVDYYSPAHQFSLSFSVVGKDKLKSFNLIEANYQYYSENWQPLEVVTNASLGVALIPKEKIVSKPSPKRTEKTGEMMHGRYKISIKYTLGGDDYECDFDIRYVLGNKVGVVGPWSGKEIH